jgi:hypothetical protein
MSGGEKREKWRKERESGEDKGKNERKYKKKNIVKDNLDI